MTGLIMLSAIGGILAWIFGLFAIFTIIFNKKPEDVKFIPIIFFSFGAIGFLLSIPGLFCMQKTIIRYESPTSIIRTNNVTVISHVVNGKPVILNSYNTTDYWNSTNIRVQVKSGQNIWNYELDDRYKVVVE